MLDQPNPLNSVVNRFSPKVQEQLFGEIDHMLSLKVNEKCSQIEWNNPVAIVRKKNGKLRFCLDARKVSKVTIKDSYPLPHILGILNRLDKTKYITTINLKDAFLQILLDVGSKTAFCGVWDKTAFKVPGRSQYQFMVILSDCAMRPRGCGD